MKIRISASATLPLFVAVAALELAAACPAQSPAASPVSNGLWQSEAVITYSGVPGMAAAHMPHTAVTQSCMGPDSWKKFGSGMESGRKDPNCTQSNFHKDAHGMTYEERCGEKGKYLSDIRADFTFNDSKHVHGTMVITTTSPSLPNPMVIHTKVNAHYVSASCGALKPGDSKMLKR